MLIENWKSFYPPILWALFIFILSVGPGVNLPDTIDISPDKLAHAFVYGVLVWLFLIIFRNRQTLTKNVIWLTIIGCSLYGLSLEVVQKTFFPHRYFELSDAIANAIGAIIGYLIFYYKNRKTKRSFSEK